MISLEFFIFVFFVVVAIVQSLFFWLPIGNENTTVRRLPFVTFAIIGLNILIFYGTSMALSSQEKKMLERYQDIQKTLERNPSLLDDKEVRKKLLDARVASQDEFDEYDAEKKRFPWQEDGEFDVFEEMHKAEARVELDAKIESFRKVKESNIYYSLGIAPDGKWKAHQLLTHMFMHGDVFHLLGNLLFFFAVGYSLEDLWGRGVFLGFYLIGGLAACLPQLIFPEAVPAIGASGAVSAVMGAFLVRLPTTKIKFGWAFTIHLFFYLIWMRMRRLFEIFGLLLTMQGTEAVKRIGLYLTVGPYIDGYLLLSRRTVNVAAYIFMPYYIMVQIASLYVEKKMGTSSGIAYSVHIAGFAFGALFAYALKYSRVEEKYIHPRIEQKISFDASPVVNESLALMDRGEVQVAESKLQAHLVKSPQDANAMMTLIQIYQNTGNYDQLNNVYARLIRQHFAQGDKEGALYAYDGLLSSFPDGEGDPKLFIRDWMMICEYLRELGMAQEAAVEYERLIKNCMDDPLVVRACVQGGEAAVAAGDKERALRLFERSLTLNPSGAYQSRIARGLAVCGGVTAPAASPANQPLHRPH